MPVSFEAKALLVAGREDEDGSAGGDHRRGLIPKQFAHPLRHPADEDAGGDLNEPTGEISTQTGRTRRQDEYYHGKSSLSA